MKYEDVASVAQTLSYRDKLRLAQLLLQLARKEEEEQNPDKRVPVKASMPSDPEMIQYVFDRLVKLKPTKKETVLNSIGAMFQFQGGISDVDKERLFAELIERQYLRFGLNRRIEYPASAA